MKLRLLLLLLLLAPALAQPSHLDTIREKGVMVVGTPGDYPPFAVRRGDTYEGLDVDLVRLAARALKAEVQFVPTDWNNLAQGLTEGRYDLAVGGITRTLARAADGAFTRPYLSIGKSPLARLEDAYRFRDLASIDQPGVRVAVNPGGTNETFARAHLKKATIVVFEDNLSIPEAIATGKADVMFTDNIEARLVARRDQRLAAIRPDAPLTRETLGWMAPRDDQAFLNWLNLFLEQTELEGELERVKSVWF
ncbi:MAG: transporter substrate-binding domain-containing protein [Vulcanimicrobiota bacterium]